MTTKELQILTVPIDKLKLAEWDVRRFAEDPEEVEAFKTSIQENGLIYPITVARMNETGDLIVIAGRRRLKALRQLGWKDVPVIVKFENVTETELRKITVIENLHRKSLVDIEEGLGILAVFQAAGFKKDEIIGGVKSIDNWFSDTRHKGATWEDIRKQLPNRENINTSELRYDRKFLEICKSLSKTPKYQYQLLQIVTQLRSDVLLEAHKKGLTTDKKIILTNSGLRNHPELLKYLIDKIKNVDRNRAAAIVRQYAEDIQSGYLIQDGDSYYYSGDTEKRNIITSGKKASEDKDKPISTYELDIRVKCEELLFLLTGRAISKKETKYTKEMIDKYQEHRYKIVKSCNGNVRELNSLFESLALAQRAITDTLDILGKELDVVHKKREMNKE